MEIAHFYKKVVRLSLFLLITCFSIVCTGQQLFPFVDMHNYGATKAFGSKSSMKASVWEEVRHDCSYDFQPAFIQAFSEMGKTSQANFEALMRSGAPITCLSYEPLQKPFLKSSRMSPNELKGTLSCLTGVVASDAIGYVSDIDYFGDFVKFYNFLKEQAMLEHEQFGKVYSFTIIDSKETFTKTRQDPDNLGVVLNLSGGHILGSSLYIENNLTASPEYASLILQNIKRLKGEIPLYENTREYVIHPVFSISLASYFPNGICGFSQSFTNQQAELFGAQSHLEQGITKLGTRVIRELLNPDNGRRILIDVSGMSLLARRQYYGMVRELRDIAGDEFPIIASHVGISGLDWDDGRYQDTRITSRGANTYLNHTTTNLSSQDILHIYDSKGLIGITLNKDLICGPAVQQELNGIVAGSAQHRELFLHSIMANIFSVVSVVQNRFAWDMITIGSDFDSIISPFPMYDSVKEMPDLANDMLEFLEDPEDLFDILTAQQVKQLMYGQKPADLVNKIFHGNAISFLEKNLPADGLAQD
ncbi:MAG: hypothetical protein AAF502_09695 [Bacteroidota bacterium]